MKKKRKSGIKHVTALTLTLSWFDMAVMNYYTELHPLTKKSTMIRMALASLLRADTHFDRDNFRQYMQEVFLPMIDDATQKEHTIRLLEEFLNPRSATPQRRKFNSRDLAERHF